MRAFFLALLLVLATPLTADAECAVYNESVLTPEVPAGTPLVIVEIFNMSSEPVPDDLATLGKQFELVTLAGAKVPLVARATHRGLNQTQVELVPTRPLAPGKYRLSRTTRPPHAQRTTHTLNVVTAAAAVVTAPQVLAAAYSYQEFGCGPGETVNLTLGAAGPYYAAATYETPRLAFVTLTTQGATQSGYVRIVAEGAKLALGVGHGMCSGEFRPVTGTTYAATLQLMGPDGGLGPATTSSLTYR